ncbi:hypothetical protein [Corynebacterium liangguodongii]|uniref:Uncharacterized protein n=1 Tax=Corynebacterium liangguodongii TaxID=2079535 RepID=A0A2S0WEB9_9CORY|nr:hypothetical protein [Corynebacterium liangguodongii]AWB84116.1 hypothetical protein C3E79_06170 [Corynebacterium liangguodongii]PWC00127.1 hypothetical protein DF219_02810 [Corynebacterium liangguodongii]
MKLRTGLLALATTTALVAGGVSVQTAHGEPSSPAPTAETSTSATATSSPSPSTSAPKDDSPETETTTVTVKPEGSSDADPDEIKAWIGVATAVISVLSTLFAFVNKNFGPLLPKIG